MCVLYMCKHSSQQPLAGQVHNVTNVVVRNQQLCVRWPGSRDLGVLGIGRGAGLKKLGAIPAHEFFW